MEDSTALKDFLKILTQRKLTNEEYLLLSNTIYSSGQIEKTFDLIKSICILEEKDGLA